MYAMCDVLQYYNVNFSNNYLTRYGFYYCYYHRRDYYRYKNLFIWIIKLVLWEELSRQCRVDHHCSLSPGERTLWRLTPFGSTRQPDSLSLSIRSHSPPPALPPYGSAKATQRCTLLHQPSLRPGVFSPLSAGKWEWTLVQRWIDPLCNLRLAPRSPSRFHGRSFLPFHPRCSSTPVAATADDDDDFSARRRTLIPISKIRLPSEPRIDWQKQRQRAPPKATPRLSFSFSATNHPWNFKEGAEDQQFSILLSSRYITILLFLPNNGFFTRNYFSYWIVRIAIVSWSSNDQN